MKKLLFFLTAALLAMSLSAAPVDQATAMKKAQSFLANEFYSGKFMSPGAIQPVLLKAEMGSSKMLGPVYYIFNTTTTFVVVAGDDRADEILMVGDRPLKDINNLPPGLQDMLGQYKDQIMYLKMNPNLRSNTLLANPAGHQLRAGTYGPLLTCNWDQEAPYYNQCKFGNYQCLTGCPATSASMVFYYWKYPTGATPAVPGYRSTISYSSYGSTSYTHSKLPSTTFDWNNMLDNYTSGYTTAQGTAVATLMHYVGQAERMGYGTSSAGGSGVSVDSVCNIRDAFTFFGYDSSTTRFVKKTSAYSGGSTLYTDAQWAALIQEEMAAGRPIVFCAVSSNAGGHAFNVDGYNSSTNKYHVNFGWSGDGNAWCSLNSFGYSSYNFNVYQQMVIGIQPPSGSTATPTLSVSPSSLSFSTTAGQTVTKTFTVTGTNLTGNVTLTKTDANGVYTISPTTISASAAASGATVTVTYKPTAAGSHSGSIAIASSGASSKTVSLSGTATAASLVTYTPVMSAANSSYITTNSFRANWTDQTSSSNVSSYTLQVTEKGTTPATSQLASIDLSNVSQVTNSDGYLTDVSSNIASYLGTGWTASTYVYANTGMLITGGNLVSPTYSLSGYSKVTVKVTAYSYYSSYYGNATLSVGTGSQTKTQALTDNSTEYTFVLNCSTSDKVTIGSTSNYISVNKIEIYAGDATSVNMFAASETGGETSRTITGITNKYYTVNNLKEGGTFVYKVKAIYTDGTSSDWSNEQEVTLTQAAAATPTLTVTPTSLSMSAYTGETATATFKVTGADLTGNVTLTKSGSSVFSITPTTITAANAANGVNVTVTYAPTATGTQTGTITIASSGATSKTVTLTGTATAAPITTYTPVMSAANSSYVTSSSFRADWTDQTASSNVASYTLQVDGQGGSTPSTGTTLLGTIDGSQYTGSYKTITLTSPWGGSNVKGGNNAVYFTKSGKITFTIPSGYSNATFSVKITTVSGTYGTGNVTVKSTKTSAVGHTFSKGETYTWIVTGSAGDVITLTTTDSSYSPDMSLIQVYAGNTTLNATETGDATSRTITGITNKYYTVSNLTAGATYTYKVKAIYTDGTSSAWSNEQTVTLKNEEPAATPTLTVTPTSLSMTANVGATKTATFKVTGADLTGNVTLSLSGASVFSISTTSITAANAANGVNVTVTYAPTAYGTQTATVTVASSGATSKTVALTGNATIEKATPVLNAATNISSTSFTANWTHDVPSTSVSSYTMYGTLTAQPDQPSGSNLLGTLDGSNYTGSYASITLTSPWGGSNVVGGNGAIYTKNSSSWWSTSYGNITFTVPSGYTNATFTIQITTANTSYGAGNITVKSAKTSAVGYTFTKGATKTWTVTASAGDKITIYSTDSSYSPDMTLINIYAGTLNLNATATGDNTDFVITDIDAGSTGITLSNLVEGGTYSYYIVANYVDGTTATSNTQEVTLTSLNVRPNTAINSIAADGDEIESVTYVNMNGVQSKEPFDGVNIVVTRYRSGAVKSSKVLY